MRIELNNTAKKQLKRINEPYLSAIIAAIDKLEREPPEGAIKKLEGRDGFRLKEGGYRILFDIDKSGGRIDIFEITRRGQAYKKGTKR
jgi:mRNA interferase RelE/StbE